MPEWPEIANLARQMQAALPGRTIAGVTVRQSRCLNLPEPEFIAAVLGAQVLAVAPRGKWLQIQTTQGWLLINLGMGGEVLLTPPAALPEKTRLHFDLDDGANLMVNFWWFGYVHYVQTLAEHTMTARLGVDALALGPADLTAAFAGKRFRLKAFLLDQARIAGIGNFYVHDILFQARLHPLRQVNTLTGVEIEALVQAIHQRLAYSMSLGGAAYEVDLHGEKGHFEMTELLVGYREGQPCPECATPVEKIKTGSTSSFVCPRCQPLTSESR